MDWELAYKIGGVISVIANAVLGYLITRQKVQIRADTATHKSAIETRRVEHEQEVADREADRVDMKALVKEWKSALAHEREMRHKDAEHCDERISKLENAREEDHRRCDERIGKLESEREEDRESIIKLKSDLLEVQAAAERAEGGNQELERQRDKLHEQVTELQGRVAHLHEEWRTKGA